MQRATQATGAVGALHAVCVLSAGAWARLALLPLLVGGLPAIANAQAVTAAQIRPPLAQNSDPAGQSNGNAAGAVQPTTSGTSPAATNANGSTPSDTATTGQMNVTTAPTAAAATPAPAAVAVNIGTAPPGGPVALSQAETAQATFLAMTQFTQTLLDPAVDGRRFDASPAPSVAAQWNVWASAFGGSRTSVSNTGSASRNFGTVVGADYALSSQTTMGFAMAGGGTNFTGNFSSGRSDLFQSGAFVRHTAGQAYVVGALAYGWQAISSDRMGAAALNAAADANAYSGRVEGGYHVTTPWLGITAYAAGQSTTFSLPANAGQPSFAANAFAAAFGADHVTDSRSELGLRTNGSFALQSGTLNLRGRLAWAHDFSAARAVPAAFQALPGLGFVASGAALATDSALVGAALELKLQNGWSAAATADGEFSQAVRSYTGRAVMHYAW
ncbi:autotransporter outer membrane beta-barrel domain-containing protein [Bradyrhizobium manausense]|uniref:autotransporter outer membrane beta-barrel domain-containing protein n=1 Tax=Bradyrhizobium TaxID=374 RepID=UPI001BADFC5C|nr:MULTISPECIES: autotransporter outer membrane beta-barrel domain-containing protein [Bradyrhizobium]MBR0829735.1 autotransporter outer membrane beta-barrel domain-containing protein [Bradyrhizobium manausense]UVO25348.1 autotransporter outer membrane beta-barrel domain-containing protein [Bradyrhizobium arachidis]